MQILSQGGSPVGNSALSLAIGDAAAVRRKLDTLTQQAGDGLISDAFSGLGSGAATALTLGPALAHVTTWQRNIGVVSGRMQTTQSALAQISEIASSFFAQTNNLNGLSAEAIDATAGSARDALRQVAGLLNSKFGETYVFAGVYTSVPPVPNPDLILSSGMVTDITNTIGQLGVNGAAATIATTLATASSNVAGTSPFAVQLSQPAAVMQNYRPVVQTGANRYEPIGIVAGSNADVPSGGPSTTGSYIRDVMRALATIGALTSGQSSVSGFGLVVQDTHASLGDAVGALNGDAGVLGNRQAALTETGRRLDDSVVALQSQISDAQDVDMADTLSRLTATQTQLQASYQLLSTLRSLSLASFLGG